MVKFAQEGPRGYVVGLGLSHDNLRRMCEQLQPIAFPASQVGLGDGQFCIGTTGMGRGLQEQLGAAYKSCIELTEPAVAALMRGEMLELQLEMLGYPRRGIVALFSGPTEEQIVVDLKRAGLLATSRRKPLPWNAIAVGLALLGLALMLVPGAGLLWPGTVAMAAGLTVSMASAALRRQ